jgi:hypothetical protein
MGRKALALGISRACPCWAVNEFGKLSGGDVRWGNIERVIPFDDSPC